MNHIRSPKYLFLGVLLVSAIVLVESCGIKSKQETSTQQLFQLKLPPGFPEPVIPEDNQLSAERVALGKALFFDKRLSKDSTIACGSCHLPEHAFADLTAKSRGIHGQLGFRNSPSLGNIAWANSFFLDGGVLTLEMQILAPLDDVKEMDLTIADVVTRLADDTAYQKAAQATYGRKLDPFVITRSIAAFERTLITGNSPYDQYFFQSDEQALTEAEKRGMALFNSERLNCRSCHAGFNFTNTKFESNGLYMDYGEDPGRKRITLKTEDEGKFKVAGLRNVGVTAPYMHDGSLATLDAVIDHYASGGTNHPNKSDQITGFTITPKEKKDLISFLHALTDPDFLKNPAFRE